MQARLLSAVQQAMKVPNTIPMASIPVAFVLAYLPHFIGVFLSLDTQKLLTMTQSACADGSESHRPNSERFKLIRRLQSCHHNGLEAALTYSTAVIVAVVLRVNPMLMAPIALRFLASRFLYMLLYIFGLNETFAGAGVWIFAMTQILRLFRMGLHATPPARRK